ncbi:MAG: hypothetical protein V4590_07420 [Bacteroidota bacterium]
MDLRSEILREHGKSQVIRIVQYVGDDPQHMQELMDLFLGNNNRITQRAAWPLSYIGIAHPDLVKPYHGKLLDTLEQSGIHDAVKRNILRLWVEIMPPEKYWGVLYDRCYVLTRSKDEAIAIRVFAMHVMGNIAIKYPELAFELKSLIDELMLLDRPAFVARGKKVLKMLDKAAKKLPR